MLHRRWTVLVYKMLCLALIDTIVLDLEVLATTEEQSEFKAKQSFLNDLLLLTFACT